MVTLELCVSSSDKWLLSSPAKSVNEYYLSWKWTSSLTFQVYLKETCTAPERNRGESWLFFRSVLWQQLLTIFPEKVKEADGILKRQSLLTVRVYSHSYQKCFIFSYEKIKLFGKFVEYYNLVWNETCNDNRML